MTASSPASGSSLARRYSVGTLDQKVQNKMALQREFGWAEEPKRPMLCFPAGMTDQLGGKLLLEVLPGILSQQVEMLVLGKGAASYGSLFTKLANEQEHRIRIIPDTRESLENMYAAADIALFLGDPAMLRELNLCLRYGVVPVSPETPLLQNYNAQQETGDAFLFESPSVWHAYAALVRAIETFRFPYDWRTIQKHCMEASGR